ncbi:MAG: hypothetical protein JWL97_2968 [Gemmatimonadales bacterium]|nr:hypothetical protein [Gemmatimonadales bacterium]
MRTFEQGKIPLIGGTVELKPHEKSEPTMDVRVRKSYGLAEVLGVTDEKGQNGIVAFHPDGSWWWIWKIDPRDPWSSDPESWKKDSTGG